MSGNFTQADLDALEQALAKGVLKVKYTDKEIQYRSVKEMLEIRDIMRSCLGDKNARGVRRLASTAKGLC